MWGVWREGERGRGGDKGVWGVWEVWGEGETIANSNEQSTINKHLTPVFHRPRILYHLQLLALCLKTKVRKGFREFVIGDANHRDLLDLLQKYFSDLVCVNSCSLFPTSTRSLVYYLQ